MLVAILPLVVIGLTIVHFIGLGLLRAAESIGGAYLNSQIAFGVFAAATSLMALAIILGSPPGSPQRLAGIALAVMGVPVLSDGVSAVLTRMPLDAVSPGFYGIASVVAFYTALGATLRFSQMFPVSLRSMASEVQAAPVSTGGLRRVYQFSLDGRAVWTTAGLAAVATAVGWGGLRFDAAMAITTVVTALVLVNFRVGYRVGRRVDRTKIIWLSQGVVATGLAGALAIGLLVVGRLMGIEILVRAAFPWIPLVGLFSGLLAVGAAVFYRGALDPRLVIRRTALYGGGSVVAVFVFAGIENLMTDYIVEVLGLPRTLGTWLAGGVVALGMAFGHGKLNKRLSRSFDA